MLNNNISSTVSSDKRQITVTGSNLYAFVHSNIPVQLIAGKTVTISCSISKGNPNVPVKCQIEIVQPDDGKKGFDIISTGSKKIEIPEEIVAARVKLYVNCLNTVLDTPNTVTYSDVMLNIGDTALPWEPYQSKTAAITLTEPLRGIGDVRDRIMCRNGMWGVERAINQVDNTGTVPISEALEILATPAWEPIPAATQSALNALTTYTGQTTITVTADGPESDITMQYYGQPGAKTNVQSMLDALARKVALELVSNTDLAVKLADYVAQTDIVQVESTATNKVPSSAYLKQVKDSIDSNLASKIAVVTYSKAGIPIAAGDDFFANIPVDIDTSVYRWVFPILSDVSGDNSTKINISNCIWQNTQVHIKGNNQAVGAANISLAGVVVAIK